MTYQQRRVRMTKRLTKRHIYRKALAQRLILSVGYRLKFGLQIQVFEYCKERKTPSELDASTESEHLLKEEKINSSQILLQN